MLINGVGADDLCWLFDFDACETSGAGEEGVGGDTEAGGDGAAEELAFGGDDVEGGSCSHVHDDGGTAEEVEGGYAVDDTIRTDFGGIVGEDGQAGLHTGLDEERAKVEEGFRSDACAGWQSSVCGTTEEEMATPVTIFECLQAAHGEEGLEEHAKLIGGLLVRGCDAPVGDHLDEVWLSVAAGTK